VRERLNEHGKRERIRTFDYGTRAGVIRAGLNRVLAWVTREERGLEEGEVWEYASTAKHEGAQGRRRTGYSIREGSGYS
jgi:hypothetical protein